MRNALPKRVPSRSRISPRRLLSPYTEETELSVIPEAYEHIYTGRGEPFQVLFRVVFMYACTVLCLVSRRAEKTGDVEKRRERSAWFS